MRTFAVHAQAKQSVPAMGVVPWPAKIERVAKPFVVSAKTRILTDGTAKTQSSALFLAQRLRVATGFPIPVEVKKTGKNRRGAILLLSTRASADLGAEGYELTANPQSVVVRAPSAAGLFYGTQTLRQLLPAQIESKVQVRGVSWTVPGVKIWDRPRFSYRGFMLDSSRHLQSEAFIRRTLDLMAYHKLNTFHWHLTDDNGWRIEIKKYPLLTSVGGWREKNGQRYGGFFTQNQIRGIVDYAAQRNISIIPEIEMPGHSAAAVASYPQLACTPEALSVRNIGEGSVELCPGKPATLAFVEDVLTEVMALFPSKVIHIGGDEVDKTRWKHCPDCQALMKRENLKNEEELQGWFTQQVATFLHSKGRRLQGWNEILRGGSLPQDAIVQQWDQPGAAVQAARMGRDVVVSQTGWTYFDYSYDAISLRKVYESEPVPEGLSPRETQHILGAQAQLWTEQRESDESADNFIWPRLIALSEVCWSPRASRDWQAFLERLNGAHFTRLALRGLGHELVPSAAVRQLLEDPTGERNLGTRLGSWDPNQMNQNLLILDWDVTALLKKSGVYSVKLRYRAGAHGLAATSLSLLEDGVEMVRDVHSSFAGTNSWGNNYALNVAQVRANARYVLRAEVRSDGGTDSRGDIYFAAPEATTK